MELADTSDPEADRTSGLDVTHAVHAMFDTREAAEAARRDLIAAGTAAASVTVQGLSAAGERADAEPPLDADETPGFWERLRSLFMPEEDRYAYAEGLRRGGFAVSVETDRAHYDSVIEILDRDGAVDLDDRLDGWRSQGWSRETDPLAGATSPALSFATAEEEPQYAAPSAATAGFSASEADHFPIGDVAAPPVESPGALPPDALSGTPDVQYPAAAPGLSPPEGAWVRDLSHGRSRIRSYVTDPARTPPD